MSNVRERVVRKGLNRTRYAPGRSFWGQLLTFLFHFQLFLPVAVPHQKIEVKAVNLTASFGVKAGNMTAIFRWDVPTTLPHQPLTGYQVTWAEVISNNRHNTGKLSHSLISQSQILPPVSSSIYKVAKLFTFLRNSNQFFSKDFRHEANRFI